MEDRRLAPVSKPIELEQLGRLEGAAWGGLLRTHARLTARMNRELVEACSMTLATYDVLRHVGLAEEGRIRPAELADRVMLTRGGLTPIVKRLQSDGLLRRDPDPQDGRGAWVQLTARGRNRLRTAHAHHVRSIREHFLALLDRDQLRALADAWQML